MSLARRELSRPRGLLLLGSRFGPGRSHNGSTGTHNPRIVPVLFGAGTRLLDTLPNRIKLEPTNMLDTPRNASMTATSTSTPHSIALYPRQKRRTLCHASASDELGVTLPPSRLSLGVMKKFGCCSKGPEQLQQAGLLDISEMVTLGEILYRPHGFCFDILERFTTLHAYSVLLLPSGWDRHS
ncbi:hypothetical protein AMC81_PD00033 (plasmid) [Rhizobium phaseoli]|uniref:Uncharacterized protein n=1 Tax=Rhizobium phaseoli TaxID=396 RepID=A0ABN4QQX5_9HYPH|nr:hypothetical protein AMC81_PD00033 [Rhizobium phaseoli]ANL94399.1 hypothetical protein AMC80_PD00033 [Rhizobium phaseoli]